MASLSNISKEAEKTLLKEPDFVSKLQPNMSKFHLKSRLLEVLLEIHFKAILIFSSFPKVLTP